MDKIGIGVWLKKTFKDNIADIDRHLYYIIHEDENKILAIKTQTFKGEKYSNKWVNYTIIDSNDRKALLDSTCVYDITPDLEKYPLEKNEYYLELPDLIKIYGCLISQEPINDIKGLDFLDKKHKEDYFFYMLKKYTDTKKD